MQFALIMAMLAALTLAEQAGEGAVSHAGLRGTVALALMLAAPLSAWQISRQLRHRLISEPSQRLFWLERYTRSQTLHLVLQLAVVAIILLPLRWPQLVLNHWQLRHAVLLDELLLLLPVVLPMFVSWACFYRLEFLVEHPALLDACGEALSAPAASTSSPKMVPTWQACLAYAGNRLRHQLGLVLLPVLGVVGLLDLLRHFAPGLLEGEQAWMVYLPVLCCLVAGFPLLLRMTWKTAPLPAGPLRGRLAALNRQAGIQVREILVWRTEGRVINALVVGFVPRFRYVLLSDGLLQALREDEIEAVYAHELGHVRQHHLALRLAALLAPVALWLALASPADAWLQARAGAHAPAVTSGHAAADASLDTWKSIDAVTTGMASLFARSIPGAWLLPMLVALYAGIVLAWYSRHLEHEADVWACRLLSAGSAGDARPRGRVLSCSAPPCGVERVVNMLERLGQVTGHPRDRNAWLHPSIARRTALLRRVGHDRREEARFRRGVRLAGAALCLLTAFSLGLSALLA